MESLMADSPRLQGRMVQGDCLPRGEVATAYHRNQGGGLVRGIYRPLKILQRSRPGDMNKFLVAYGVRPSTERLL